MRKIFRRVWTGAKAFALTAIMSLGFVQGAEAQTSGSSVAVDKNFTVCPLNVDGLPAKILGITINPDGKGETGATAIGEYLKNKGIDVVALSEDFNYHNAIVDALGDGYKWGSYRGGLTTDKYEANIRFNTDGLEFLTKLPTSFSNESWTEWSQSYGKFTNGSDELIKKGYRYYTVNLGDGVLVDFYTMHMDANDAAEDNAARATQWEQLCNAILNSHSNRPVIVMGDTNSRYTRDDIYGKFITPLSDKYDVTDAWVQLCRGGVAPTLGDEALVVPDDKKLDPEAYKSNEIVDKVIYLNPKDATYKLTANTIDFDAANYQNDGSLLGDHVPVIVGFNVNGEVVTKFEATAANNWWRGEELVGNDQEVYLYNVGTQYFISQDTKPTYKDIKNATIWRIHNGDNGDGTYTINDCTEDGYRLRMDATAPLFQSTKVGLVKGSGATNFGIAAGTTTDKGNAYKFTNTYGLKRELHYFNIDGSEYTGAVTPSTDNDWLLISQTQKETYEKYDSLYNVAKGYLHADGLSNELDNELADVLKNTANSNYDKSAGDIKSLEDIIEAIKKWFYRDVKVTTAKYATLCLPWNAQVPENVTVYYATKYDANVGYVHLEKYEGNVIPGHTGFVIFSDVNETTNYRFFYSPESAAQPDGNILSGTVDGIAHEGLSFDKYDYLLLGNKSRGVGFYVLDETSYIPACRAYIQVAHGEGTKNSYAAFDFNGEAGVEGVNASSVAKVVAVYGISGEKRSTMQHGLNIVKMSDGTVKKVMVK